MNKKGSGVGDFDFVEFISQDLPWHELDRALNIDHPKHVEQKCHSPVPRKPDNARLSLFDSLCGIFDAGSLPPSTTANATEVIKSSTCTSSIGTMETDSLEKTKPELVTLKGLETGVEEALGIGLLDLEDVNIDDMLITTGDIDKELIKDALSGTDIEQCIGNDLPRAAANGNDLLPNISTLLKRNNNVELAGNCDRQQVSSDQGCGEADTHQADGDTDSNDKEGFQEVPEQRDISNGSSESGVHHHQTDGEKSSDLWEGIMEVPAVSPDESDDDNLEWIRDHLRNYLLTQGSEATRINKLRGENDLELAATEPVEHLTELDVMLADAETELRMIKLDAELSSALSASSPDIDRCCQLLNDFDTHQLTPSIVVRYPFFAGVVDLCCRWNGVKAEELHAAADRVRLSITAMFGRRSTHECFVVAIDRQLTGYRERCVENQSDIIDLLKSKCRLKKTRAEHPEFATLATYYDMAIGPKAFFAAWDQFYKDFWDPSREVSSLDFAAPEDVKPVISSVARKDSAAGESDENVTTEQPDVKPCICRRRSRKRNSTELSGSGICCKKKSLNCQLDVEPMNEETKPVIEVKMSHEAVGGCGGHLAGISVKTEPEQCCGSADGECRRSTRIRQNCHRKDGNGKILKTELLEPDQCCRSTDECCTSNRPSFGAQQNCQEGCHGNVGKDGNGRILGGVTVKTELLESDQCCGSTDECCGSNGACESGQEDCCGKDGKEKVPETVVVKAEMIEILEPQQVTESNSEGTKGDVPTIPVHQASQAQRCQQSDRNCEKCFADVPTDLGCVDEAMESHIDRKLICLQQNSSTENSSQLCAGGCSIGKVVKLHPADPMDADVKPYVSAIQVSQPKASKPRRSCGNGKMTSEISEICQDVENACTSKKVNIEVENSGKTKSNRNRQKSSTVSSSDATTPERELIAYLEGDDGRQQHRRSDRKTHDSMLERNGKGSSSGNASNDKNLLFVPPVQIKREIIDD